MSKHVENLVIHRSLHDNVSSGRALSTDTLETVEDIYLHEALGAEI